MEKPVQAFKKAFIKNRIIKKNKKTNGPQLKMGDKMYLLIKNLKTQRPTKKLDYIKVKPFFINKIYYIKDGHHLVNYKL